MAGGRLPVAVPDRRASTYLQARYLDPPANRSKYDNPSARLAANPRLAWTRPVGPPTDGVLVVCEGTADALIAAQAGIAAVGVLGAAYPDRRVADGIAAGCRQHPRLHGAEVVVCFDADPAGAAGSARLVELLADRGIPASERRPPDGLDLTTWSALDPRWTDALPTAHRHGRGRGRRRRARVAGGGAGRVGGGAEHLHRRDRLSVGRTDLR